MMMIMLEYVETNLHFICAHGWNWEWLVFLKLAIIIKYLIKLSQFISRAKTYAITVPAVKFHPFLEIFPEKLCHWIKYQWISVQSLHTVMYMACNNVTPSVLNRRIDWKWMQCESILPTRYTNECHRCDQDKRDDIAELNKF